MSTIRVTNLKHESSASNNIVLDSSGNLAVQAGSASTPAIQATGDSNTGIYFSAADTVDVTTGGTRRFSLDSSGNLKFNSGYGSVATAYGCRAWVNFNGTGTIAIRASGNVSSLTDHAAGEYSVSFTNSMPDANYVCHMDSEVEAGNDNRMHSVVYGGRAAGSVRVHVGGTATEDGPDPEAMMVTIFR